MSGEAFYSRRRMQQAAVFVICLLVGVALAAVRWTGGQQVPPPSLIVDPADLNLGTVWQQPRLQFTLPIHNPGDHVVLVDKLTPSCNCTGVSPESFSLRPGETLPVQVTVDTAKSIREASAAEDSFLVTLTARLTAPVEHVLQWPLRGVVRRSLHVSPGAIILQGANEVISGVPSPTVVAEVKPQIQIAELKAEWSPSEADVDLDGPDAHGHYFLRYTARNDLPRGTLQTQVTLRTKLRDGTAGPSLEVPVRGVVVPPVRLSPDRITLRGRQEHPETGPPLAGVNLVPLDGQDWLITAIDGAPEWLEVDTQRVPGAFLLEASDPPSEGETASLVVHAHSSRGDVERLLCTVIVPALPKYQRHTAAITGAE